MGTRGLWGFHKDGVDKLAYNHLDSYPEYLGDNIVKFAKETPVSELNKIFERIILVNECDKPTEQQIEECKQYANLGVSSQSYNDWYCLLRETQGDPYVYRDKGLKYMVDYASFIKSSLFCEWAYIINLTDNTLEIYRGYRRRKNTKKNRYRVEKPYEGYYACEITNVFPLEAIPADWLLIVKGEERAA